MFALKRLFSIVNYHCAPCVFYPQAVIDLLTQMLFISLEVNDIFGGGEATSGNKELTRKNALLSCNYSNALQ